MVLSLAALFLSAAIPVCSEAADIIVTSLADSGPGSLRQAIADAPDGGTIGFGVEGDLVLTSGELLVDKSLRVFGGRHRQVTVRVAANLFDTRVFKVTGAPVTLSYLTIQDGNNSLLDNVGGGIYNLGDLLLQRVTIRDNKSVVGGGLYNESGAIVTIVDSTISGNLAVDPGICDGGYGGGIGNGGGIVNLINCTITDNQAQCLGGGVFQSSGTVRLSNTIVAKQSFSSDCRQGFFNSVGGTGQFISRGFNLDSDRTCGLDQSSDLPGVNPLLGPLQDMAARLPLICQWSEVQQSMPATPSMRHRATSEV